MSFFGIFSKTALSKNRKKFFFDFCPLGVTPEGVIEFLGVLYFLERGIKGHSSHYISKKTEYVGPFLMGVIVLSLSSIQLFY